ncbi:aldehyde dehydrogenase family protein [Arthrobacter sp. 1088]|uniref:aldehyde dehydrogenase family protein n=1 Tax=Arthrobacter sp. 1088 TaxID=2817768 RepID=UPI00286A188E|nr:aldehyde dehydrogenase family protein [Arthrobacter sp. 1088]
MRSVWPQCSGFRNHVQRSLRARRKDELIAPTGRHRPDQTARRLQFVFGSGAIVGQATASHPDVAAVSFTGSNSVGTVVAQACHARGARVQMEMGGKNALVVSPSAPVATAASIAARGAFGLTGQACTATSRVILLPGSEDAFIAALLEAARNYTPRRRLGPSHR